MPTKSPSATTPEHGTIFTGKFLPDKILQGGNFPKKVLPLPKIRHEVDLGRQPDDAFAKVLADELTHHEKK